MTNDPIADIEDKNTWMSFGRQAYLIFRGAKEEGANDYEAHKMVVTFYEGMFRSSAKDEETDKDDSVES